MKRFRVHVHVEDLPKNVAFYSAMFNRPPARSETDYAKWMLDDPPLNFAISTRGDKPGVGHLGPGGRGGRIDRIEEQCHPRRHDAAGRRADHLLLRTQRQIYWPTDPQGIAWEQFHTLDNIPVFSAGKSPPLHFLLLNHAPLSHQCPVPLHA